MNILETVFEREKQAQKVKESGKVDRFYGDSELVEAKGFSFNVAWSRDDQRQEAEQKYQNLSDDTGYKIDYSVMGNK